MWSPTSESSSLGLPIYVCAPYYFYALGLCNQSAPTQRQQELGLRGNRMLLERSGFPLPTKKCSGIELGLACSTATTFFREDFKPFSERSFSTCMGTHATNIQRKLKASMGRVRTSKICDNKHIRFGIRLVSFVGRSESVSSTQFQAISDQFLDLVGEKGCCIFVAFILFLFSNRLYV